MCMVLTLIACKAIKCKVVIIRTDTTILHRATGQWYLCNISNTKKSVSSDIETLRSWLKKQTQLTNLYRVFHIASQSINI